MKAPCATRSEDIWNSEAQGDAHSPMATLVISPKPIGLAHWMGQVLLQAEKAAESFDADAVHDLRTALRRCRSIADGMMAFDADPAWKKMKKAGKQLFQSLGELRDTHVLRDWVEHLAPESDPSALVINASLAHREEEFRITAAAAVHQFDRAKWSEWARRLPSRAVRTPLDSPVFAQLALERWQQARELHRRALRNRTNVAFHNLRIGIKRFRYTVENFLPTLHELWADDLKDVQDSLGDVHDLDVLWQTILGIQAFPDAASREIWRSRVREERARRIEKYRSKMVGEGSLWNIWRAALPGDDRLRELGSQRLKIWASLLDPNVSHSRHVAELAMQIFDGLPSEIPPVRRQSYRYVLYAAALMHEVGCAKVNRGHHKVSARMIRKIAAPMGWTIDEIHTIAMIARYHRGALPSEKQKRFRALPASKQASVKLLAGILRFACACDLERDAGIRHIKIEASAPVLTVRARGYAAATPLAEHLAAARHLLEVAYQRPVFILPDESHAA